MTDTYTIDPPTVDPSGLDDRITQLEQLGELFDRMIATPTWRMDERWWVAPWERYVMWNGIRLRLDVAHAGSMSLRVRLQGITDWREIPVPEPVNGVWNDRDDVRRALRRWLDTEYPVGPPRRCYPGDWPVWALPPV